MDPAEGENPQSVHLNYSNTALYTVFNDTKIRQFLKDLNATVQDSVKLFHG